MFSKLSQLLDGFLEIGVPGYDCIVYHKGKQVFRQYGGVSSLEEKIPTNGREKYFIYSCSKPITAAAGLVCLERNLFSLEDPLFKYLPEFETMSVRTDSGLELAKRPITIKDLFCMTAGFGYDCHCEQLQRCISECGGKASTRETMKYLAQEPLLFHPGERWEYSFCLDVLVAVIEVVSGQRFDDFVKENIFDKIGMADSAYRQPTDTTGIAEQYLIRTDEATCKNIGKKILDFTDFGCDYESGGAGCLSTAEDCIRFLEAMRSGEKILKRSTIDRMITNQLTAEQMKTYWMPGYGYGLGVKCPIGTENCEDFGWGGMAGALMSVDIARELSIFYVQHAIGTPNDVGRYMIPGLVREALGLETKPVVSTLDGQNIYI